MTDADTLSSAEEPHTSVDEPSRGVAELQLATDLPEAVTEGLATWIDGLVRRLSPTSTSLVVRLVDEGDMRQINHSFRNQDRATDVLSFPGEPQQEGAPHLGDIVIAVPLAESQAQDLGHSLRTEIQTLTLHGILHCMGYDHETDDGEMERIENELRARWIDREEMA